MRAVTQERYGGAELLQISEIPCPRPGPGEVLVQVKAAAISPGDRAMFTGIPYINRLAVGALRRPKTPIPGYDVAGVVAATGGSSTRFKKGDPVFGNARGSCAEFVVARDDQLVAKPASWTFEQAAAVPESGCVALQAVRDRGAVRPGEHVAVIGAGGGVGSYAVQIAKSLRAVVTGVCSHAMADGVLALGADQVFDYATSSFERQRDRYDVIIDTAGKTPLRSLRRALTTTGRLVIVGADHGHRLTGGLDRWARAILWSLFIQQDLRPFVAEPVSKERLEDLAALMQGGELVPVVDRTFPLCRIAEAMRHLDHRTRPGKTVITV